MLRSFLVCSCSRCIQFSAKMTSDNGFDIEKLQGGDDYYQWKFSMRMFLLGRDLWEIVDGSETIYDYASESEQRKFKRRENHALSKICLSVAPSLHIYVRNCKSAKEAWESLEKKFEEKSLTKKIEYRRKLYDAKFSMGMAMIDHVNNLKTITERLEALGDPVTENDLVMILISSLTDTYNNLITSLENLKEDDLSWEYVRDRVLSEYERRQGEEKKDRYVVHDALLVDNREKNVHPRHDDKDNVECFYCKKLGHYKSDCPKLERRNMANFVKGVDELSIGEDDFVPEFALHTENFENNQKHWIVDSGCSKHMSFVRSVLLITKNSRCR